MLLGFSKANRNGGKNDFQNNAKTFLLIDAIQNFQPEMASFENVTGVSVSVVICFVLVSRYLLLLLSEMLDAEGMLGNETVHYWEKLLSMLLLDTAYHFRAGILKASDYGDPQNRKRLFIVAAKRGRKLPDFPKPTHGGEDLPAYVNVKDVLLDLASVKPDIGNGQVPLVNWSFTDDHSLDGIPSLCKPGPDREKLNALFSRTWYHSTRDGYSSIFSILVPILWKSQGKAESDRQCCANLSGKGNCGEYQNFLLLASHMHPLTTTFIIQGQRH